MTKERIINFLFIFVTLLISRGLADFYRAGNPQPEILVEIPIEYLLENPELHLGEKIQVRGAIESWESGKYRLYSSVPESLACIEIRTEIVLPLWVEIVVGGILKPEEGEIYFLEVISYNQVEEGDG